MTFAVLFSPSSFVAILHHIHWRIRWDSQLFARFSNALCTTKVCSNLSYYCNIFCSILHSFMIHIHYILNSVCDEYIWWAFSVEFAAECGYEALTLLTRFVVWCHFCRSTDMTTYSMEFVGNDITVVTHDCCAVMTLSTWTVTVMDNR